MGDLEDIDRAAQLLCQTACEQLRIDLLLHVAREEHRPAAVAQVDHDGLVVDLFAVIARLDRHRAGQRPFDVELDAIEPQAIAGGDGRGRPSLFSQDAPIRCIARSTTDHARFDNATDPIALEQEPQTADVVLVRMSEHDKIDASVPGRNACVEAGQLEVGIGTCVDEHPAALWAFEED